MKYTYKLKRKSCHFARNNWEQSLSASLTKDSSEVTRVPWRSSDSSADSSHADPATFVAQAQSLVQLYPVFNTRTCKQTI